MKARFGFAAMILTLGLAACGQQSDVPKAGADALPVLATDGTQQPELTSNRLLVLLKNDRFTAQSTENENGVLSLSTTQAQEFKALAVKVASDYGLEVVGAQSPLMGYAVFTGEGDLKAKLSKLELDPRVNMVVEDSWNVPLATNDPYFDRLWGLKIVNAEGAWQYTKGNPRVTVAVLDTGVGAPVGDMNVLDNHPELSPNMVSGYDFVSSYDLTGLLPASLISAYPQLKSIDADTQAGPDASPGEEYTLTSTNPRQVVARGNSHGMHVMGTIAAAANNGIGIAGVAPNVKVMPIRVLGSIGGFSSDILLGVQYAAGMPVVLEGGAIVTPSRKANVINMSLGGARTSAQIAFEESLYSKVLNERNVLTVVAAGNESVNVNTRGPAGVPSVFTVSSVDHVKDMQQSPFTHFFSNFGTGVDIAAPGGICWNTKADYLASNYPAGRCTGTDEFGNLNEALVLSTTWHHFTSNFSARTDTPAYSLKAGTSMASPHVAGVAALVLSANPYLRASQVADILQSTAGDVVDPTLVRNNVNYGQAGRDIYYGPGVVNAKAAVELARNTR